MPRSEKIVKIAAHLVRWLSDVLLSIGEFAHQAFQKKVVGSIDNRVLIISLAVTLRSNYRGQGYTAKSIDQYQPKRKFFDRSPLREASWWRPRPDSNQDQLLRREPFYPWTTGAARPQNFKKDRVKPNDITANINLIKINRYLPLGNSR